MEQPRALAMIICDDVIEDRRTHKKSLIGIFNQIVASNFPAIHPKMHIFFSLTNGRGKCKAVLQHTSLSDLEVLKEIQGEIHFLDPNMNLEYTFELLNVSFPRQGRYSFQLLLDGKLVMERVFEVLAAS